MVGVSDAGTNRENKKRLKHLLIKFCKLQFMIKKKIKLYMYNLLFIVSNQVLVVFNLKYEYGTDIFTKQQKSDNDKILNFDVKAEQLTHIKFVEISEKDLMRPPNCLNKNHTIASDKLLKFMGFFFH